MNFEKKKHLCFRRKRVLEKPMQEWGGLHKP